MIKENNFVPDLNQDVYRRLLKIIIRRKYDALSEVMKEYAGYWVKNVNFQANFQLIINDFQPISRLKYSSVKN